MKALAEVLKPDVRQEGFVVREINGSVRAMMLGDCYKDIEAISLVATVPEKIQQQFEVARDLMLYGWFVYEFYTVAYQQALVCLEFGLREACEIVNGGVNPCEKRKGLACYMKWAEKHGLIPLGKYHEKLGQFLPNLRNSAAHGSDTLLNYAMAMPGLKLVACLLNDVFSAEAVASCQAK